MSERGVVDGVRDSHRSVSAAQGEHRANRVVVERSVEIKHAIAIASREIAVASARVFAERRFETERAHVRKRKLDVFGFDAGCGSDQRDAVARSQERRLTYGADAEPSAGSGGLAEQAYGGGGRWCYTGTRVDGGALPPKELVCPTD